MTITSISFNYLFTMRMSINVPPYSISLTPSGEKSYFDVTGGTVKGDGNSVLTRSDGWADVDINSPAMTDQGIYVGYQGTAALRKGELLSFFLSFFRFFLSILISPSFCLPFLCPGIFH